MQNVSYFIALLAGFFALVKGADVFVDGSSALARRFRVPSLIIGLTVVALGTSAPELAVSVSAAIQKSNEIALSNVVGSNIFNLLAVLGLCSLINPLSVDTSVLRRDLPVSFGATLAVLLVPGAFRAFSDFSGFDGSVGVISRPFAAVLLLAFLAYTAVLILTARKNRADDDAIAAPAPLWKSLIFIVLGLALIVIGGRAVVYGAKNIAALLGMSETLIGLTVVAAGTSLPELVTSAVAAKKGETALALGNAVGSCIFNLGFILGVSALINPIGVNAASAYDLALLVLAHVLTLVFAFTAKTVKRGEGALMLAVYSASVVFAVLR